MIPIGDSTKRGSRPWVNYTLLALNLGVFIWLLTLSTSLMGTFRGAQGDAVDQAAGSCYGLLTPPTELNEAYCELGFQPREFFDVVTGDESLVESPNRLLIALSILTSLFIHGGWLHLAGNMIFLWVFGDNVEDRLGHLTYLFFYLAAGVVASLVQGGVEPESVVPVVGASGCVAGVLGAYLLFFPRATVYVVIPFFILIFIPLPIPAVLMIGFWFVQNLLAGVASLGDAANPDAGVAWFAHLGGFAFGLIIALAFRGERRRARVGRG